MAQLRMDLRDELWPIVDVSVGGGDERVVVVVAERRRDPLAGDARVRCAETVACSHRAGKVRSIQDSRKHEKQVHSQHRFVKPESNKEEITKYTHLVVVGCGRRCSG